MMLSFFSKTRLLRDDLYDIGKVCLYSFTAEKFLRLQLPSTWPLISSTQFYLTSEDLLGIKMVVSEIVGDQINTDILYRAVCNGLLAIWVCPTSSIEHHHSYHWWSKKLVHKKAGPHRRSEPAYILCECIRARNAFKHLDKTHVTTCGGQLWFYRAVCHD